MTPELPLAFPFVQIGHDVHVKYPVMINPTTIITPEAALRVIYLPPRPSNDPNDMTLVHHASMEQAYSRDTSSGKDKSDLPPDVIHALEGMRRTVWNAPNNFQLALAQYPTDYIHIMYGLPRKDKEEDIVDQIFSFFDGLFLGLPDGKVTVIAVEDKSKAEQAGIKAGDEIISVGGQPVNGNLNTFANAYAQAKDAAQFSQQATYAMVVRSPGAAERTAQLAMPPNLNTDLLMQGVSK